MLGVRAEGMIEPHPWRGDEYERGVRDGDRACNKKEWWKRDSKWGRSMISWKSVQKGVILGK